MKKIMLILLMITIGVKIFCINLDFDISTGYSNFQMEEFNKDVYTNWFCDKVKNYGINQKLSITYPLTKNMKNYIFLEATYLSQKYSVNSTVYDSMHVDINIRTTPIELGYLYRLNDDKNVTVLIGASIGNNNTNLKIDYFFDTNSENWTAFNKTENSLSFSLVSKTNIHIYKNLSLILNPVYQYKKSEYSYFNKKIILDLTGLSYNVGLNLKL